MSIFFISLIFNTFFFLLYWGIKFLFQNSGQSWHHSWEKWYYIWESFKNHENFSSNILLQPFSKINPCVDHIDFELLHFEDRPLCWSYFLKILVFKPLHFKDQSLVLISFSKNLILFYFKDQSLVLISFSKNLILFHSKINPLCWSHFPKNWFYFIQRSILCVDLIFQKFDFISFKDQSLVLIIFSKNWFQIIIFKYQPSCWSYFLQIDFQIIASKN